MMSEHTDEQDWDLEERDRLVEDGTLTDEEAPDPTVVVIEEDD